MIAKLIVHDTDRNAALQRLRVALDDYKVFEIELLKSVSNQFLQVVGCTTNTKFLKKLASHQEFIAGNVETGFIQVIKLIQLHFSINMF